jgi:hypothetical protein
MKGQLIAGEGSGVTEMRIPAFACADEQNTIASVANDIAVIAKAEFDRIARRRGTRQQDVEKIVTACGALIGRRAAVRKRRKRFRALCYLFDVQKPGKLKGNQTFAGLGRANANRC